MYNWKLVADNSIVHSQTLKTVSHNSIIIYFTGHISKNGFHIFISCKTETKYVRLCIATILKILTIYIFVRKLTLW